MAVYHTEFRVNRFLFVFLLLSALLLSSCGAPPELRVREAVVKLSPVDNNPSALYFTVHGGMEDVNLVRVTSRSAIRIEMHDTVSDPKTGMLTMKPIQRIGIPAKGKVEFRRGGKHVMLWGINLPARRLEKMEIDFVFSNGDRIRVTAPLEKIAAGGEDHSGH
jgi:periplasmic copper chaperone A